MNNEINIYLNDILKKKLKKLGVLNNCVYKILDDIKMRLESLIYNWNDIEIRDAILSIALEEAEFYEPNNNKIISCLVVFAIRNSLLEDIASVEHSNYGLKTPINSDEIKNITMTAINYFLNVNLEELSKNIKIESNYYLDILNKYPESKNVLIYLSKLNDNNLEINFESKNISKYKLKELENVNTNNKYEEKNYESGITDKFNKNLIYILSSIEKGDSKVFFAPTFKHITRNFEKLLKIMEFLLTNDGIYITSNFFITKNYVSRRKKLVKVNNSDIFEHAKTLDLVSKKYKELLNELKNVYE